MQLRRIVPVAALVAALAGCEPSVPQTAPANVHYVVFDPATSQIPLPNDLALSTAPTTAPKNASEELLQTFAAQKGFPNDQEVPVTIDLQSVAGPLKKAPDANLDVATLTPGTFVFLERKANTASFAPVSASDYEVAYAKKSDRGTLTLRKKPDPVTKSRRWNAGSQYVVVLRGGANGAKLVGGGELSQMAVMYLLTRGVVLTDSTNNLQTLLPGTRAERAAEAAQLEQLRQQYLPLFATVEALPPSGFGWGAGASRDIVSIQTFQIAPSSGPQVVYDASAGVVPFPSDLLLDPATGGKTVVNNPAFGPLAAGIATLDGFSTTAMLLAQTSAPVVMSTVNKDSVFLYDLSDPAHPVRLKEVTEALGTGDVKGGGFVAEPYLIGKTASQAACPGPTNTNCFSTAIGLQPAITVPTPSGSGLPPFVTLPPLKEKTEYAVIVTSSADASGNVTGVAALGPTGTPVALQPSTVTRILLFANPLVDVAGKSQVPGQDDATAAGLESMRQGIAAALAALQAEKPSITKAKVAAAYTVRTQSITETSLNLAAAPYRNAAAFVPGTPTAIPLATIQAQTGLTFPDVQEVLSVPVPTLNPIDPTTGAMNPDTTKWSPLTMTAYVIVPRVGGPAQVTCNGASTLKCAPLVIVQHGLGGTKSHVFAIANTLAQAGFVVAAIDSPLHGERAYCTSDAECTCAGVGGSCTAKCNFFGPAGLQGDAVQIGACAAPSTAVPGVSGKFFVSANFFRTRDANRGTVLDVSALILALAPPATPTSQFAAELASKGIFVDATRVHWIGQSLGGIYGTINTASNPRIGRAVLNVPGATFVDIFTGSPSFAPAVTQLLSSLNPPITPGTPEYLQFINVAKWVFDPGDPINYARHLLGDASHPTLPDLLSNKPAQTPKQILGQYAICDQTVPNQFNLFLLDQIGLSQTPTSGSGYTAYNVSGEAPNACTSASGSAHGFLLSPTGATAAGQGDAAAYLLNQTLPATAIRP